MTASQDILIVDDDHDIALAVRSLLEHRHHEVRIALDLETAREEIERTPPEVLICDLWIHGNRSDVFLAWVGGLRPPIRRVLYSGSERRAWRDLLPHGLVELVIRKPSDAPTLFAAVEAAPRRTGGSVR